MGLEIWMMSNRQPWVEAVLSGVTNFKTRSAAVNLPHEGDVVLLHSSLTLWQGWQGLKWTKALDVKNLPKGCICGIATVRDTGLTYYKSYLNFRPFSVYDTDGRYVYNCADEQCIVFENIKRVEPFACKGVLVPTRKISSAIIKHFEKELKDYVS